MFAFLVGVALWTLIEYLLHRFVFHRFHGIVGSFHHEHHREPRNLRYLFVRPSYAAGISALSILAIWALTGDMGQTLKLMAGVWLGYAYYEIVHYRIHFTATEGGLIARQRRAHFQHHFHNARRCFGVTSPVWDWVFRTTFSG